MQNNLTEMIDRYGRLKAEVDSYKKQIDADNTAIKALLIEGNQTSASGESYNVTCKAIETPKLNEDLLIQKLKEMGFTSCIKTKEYVDMDELEAAVYAGKVDGKLLKDCKSVSVSYRLNVYKNKE